MIKKTTIEDLARMIGKGFEGVDRQFTEVRERLGRIENLLIEEHRQRIVKLEERVKKLEDVLAV